MSRGNAGKPMHATGIESSAETPRRLFLALAAAEQRERQLFKVIDWTAYEHAARTMPTVPKSGRRAVVSFAVIAVGASVVAVPALPHKKQLNAAVGPPTRDSARLSDRTRPAEQHSVTRSDGVTTGRTLPLRESSALRSRLSPSHRSRAARAVDHSGSTSALRQIPSRSPALRAPADLVADPALPTVSEPIPTPAPTTEPTPAPPSATEPALTDPAATEPTPTTRPPPSRPRRLLLLCRAGGTGAPACRPRRPRSPPRRPRHHRPPASPPRPPPRRPRPRRPPPRRPRPRRPPPRRPRPRHPPPRRPRPPRLPLRRSA